MYTNYSYSWDRRRKRGVPAALWACVAAALAIVSSVPVFGGDVQTVVKLSVDDPRPVAKALERLEDKYGWRITYEDPRYAYPGDIEDVTTKVRKDLDQFE